jgi:hypothetical protein
LHVGFAINDCVTPQEAYQRICQARCRSTHFQIPYGCHTTISARWCFTVFKQYTDGFISIKSNQSHIN